MTALLIPSPLERPPWPLLPLRVKVLVREELSRLRGSICKRSLAMPETAGEEAPRILGLQLALTTSSMRAARPERFAERGGVAQTP
ncbi:serine/threonine-protein kinase PSK1 [Colletotrichum scovillei]|uniref:Serine/threonine-protein kinase PSK1 n=1 Tax=Colletotrichum scovillei TaxID=1209932 RepID=A0A9P7R6I6_9PEZI|nr:serine/threonine-protein kinase PSK1 [Colletotrichum scovillei]KAG7069342.1 serine/threonine-protein kinase PSK1 [Colletotrichum scovillei]KAG7073291.1 serine/threonine-protein kinase PSK1 [Colletotrichum scovillei]